MALRVKYQHTLTPLTPTHEKFGAEGFTYDRTCRCCAIFTRETNINTKHNERQRVSNRSPSTLNESAEEVKESIFFCFCFYYRVGELLAD